MEYSKFTLPPNFDFGILPNKDKKVCVVSFIGQSDLFAHSNKCQLLEELIGRNGFSTFNMGNSRSQSHHGSNASLPETVHIEGFYHAPQRVIFLNLLSCHDALQLSKLCDAISEQDPDLHDIGAILASEEFKFARALLYIFSISHIVVLSCLGTHFDPNYLRLFKLLETMRKKLLSPMCNLLRSVQSMSREWASAARPCCPRLLVNFNLVPSLLTDSLTQEQLERLTQNLEGQLFRVLRKSSLITNTTANCLFAIPTVQGFVHVSCVENDDDHLRRSENLLTNVKTCELEGFTDPAGRFLNLLSRGGLDCLNIDDNHVDKLFEHYSQPYEAQLQQESVSGRLDIWRSLRGGGGLLSERASGLDTFESLLSRHIEVARAGLYEDRGPPAARHWELPTARTWFKVCHKLYSALLREPEGAFKVALGPLRALSDVGSRFSESRCNKALPIAESVYKEGLPQHYSRAFHLSKVAAAKRYFLTQARGPLAQSFLERLEEACNRVWMSGRQMCEVFSVTGHACTNEVHRLPPRTLLVPRLHKKEPGAVPDADMACELPELSHKSDFKLRAACSCGRKQELRPDPFNYKEANVDFYSRMADICCSRYQGLTLPRYVSTSESSALSQNVEVADKTATASQLTCDLHDSSIVNEEVGVSQVAAGLDQKHSDLRERSATELDELIPPSDVPRANRPLDGMWHDALPWDLLPCYNSWSVLAIGKYSSYSHSTGVEQCGFLHGSNYLLPWDVPVTDPAWLAALELAKKSASISGSRGGYAGHFHSHAMRKQRAPAGSAESADVTVKVFFGFEYECPLGHRFFLATPDKMMKGAMQGGQVKEAVQRLLAGPLPLYFPCQCRPTKGYLAQLMRIYVAVPSSPLHVQLRLRVRPGPASSGTPVFTPGTKEPLLLLPGELWVVRLPMCYEDQKRVYRWPDPNNSDAMEHCKLLENAITAVEIAAS